MERPDTKELKKFIKITDFPRNILIETVAECNLKCIMCPQKQLSRKKGQMTESLWKRIIDEIASKSPKTKIWPAYMGEPLILGSKLFKMLRYAKEKGIEYIGLNTNLTLFKHNMVDELLSCGIDEIFIGLDGYTEKTYNKIRCSGDFCKVIENIKTIVSEKRKRAMALPKVNIQFIVMDENEAEEEDFINYWMNTGLDVKLKLRRKSSWSYGVKPWQKVVDAMKTQERIPCTWLLSQMVVFWDGMVPGCDNDWDGKNIYGDINQSDIENIWNGPILALRNRHISNDYDFEPCKNCDDWLVGVSKTIDCSK